MTRALAVVVALALVALGWQSWRLNASRRCSPKKSSPMTPGSLMCIRPWSWSPLSSKT